MSEDEVKRHTDVQTQEATGARKRAAFMYVTRPNAEAILGAMDVEAGDADMAALNDCTAPT
jgi:hypothetical protein